MNKVLVICGQTATGKTDLGFYLAKKYNGEIISADSRQVYKGMDIGTGKDIPDKNIPIYGINLVEPDQEFSVSHFREYALQKIDDIHKKNKLAIIVGGTGFYIDAVFSDTDLIDVPKNNELRSELVDKTASELYQILLNLNQDVATGLNNSEKNNKQRLVRRIEIVTSDTLNRSSTYNDFDVLRIGLKLEKNRLEKRIQARIKKRISQGFEQELHNLVEKYGELDIFSKTPGYKDFPSEETWLKSEMQYAKRQRTWFNKNKDIHWFEADDPDLRSSVEDCVGKWYSKVENAKKN